MAAPLRTNVPPRLTSSPACGVLSDNTPATWSRCNSDSRPRAILRPGSHCNVRRTGSQSEVRRRWVERSHVRRWKSRQLQLRCCGTQCQQVVVGGRLAARRTPARRRPVASCCSRPNAPVGGIRPMAGGATTHPGAPRQSWWSFLFYISPVI